MRILHINSYGRFSTGNIAGYILKSLPNSYEKELIYGREDSSYPFAKKIGGKLSSFNHVILNKLFGRNGQYSIFNTIKIINEIKRFNPDIIHLHNLHGYYVNYPMLLKYIKSLNIKVVWTLHDCWPFTGYCTHFDRAKCYKWKQGCEHCPIYNKYGYKTLIDTSKSQYKAKKEAFLGVKNLTIVTPSQWLCDLVGQSFLKDYKHIVINNGIDVDVFKPVKAEIFKDFTNKKIILGVANPFTDLKGYADFIHLNEIIDKEEYQIVLVGVNPEQKQQLEGNGIIGILRTKNQQELAELYSRAFVFINPTYEDNFPTTNLEALCCGTPVITYNTGGSIESITDSNGIIVEQGDIFGVKQAIDSISNKKIDRENVSKVARDKYSIDNMVKRYISLYDIKP